LPKCGVVEIGGGEWIRVMNASKECPVPGIDSSQLDRAGLMRLFSFLIPHGFSLHTLAGSKSKLAVL
jgi:hypothetical protein